MNRTEQNRTEQNRTEQNRTEQTYARNSSLELLRIVAMLMIVACHFAAHGEFHFPSETITLNRLYQQFILMGGSLGNDIFVMISGYFLVKSSALNLRKLFNLWLRLIFYSVIIYLVFLFSGMKTFDIKTAIKILMPVTRTQWWFASTYFVMYLIHPYINILIHSFSRDDYKKFLAAVLIYWCIIPTLTKSNFQGSSLIYFICLYSLSGYVRLWAYDFGNKKFIWLGLSFILLNFLSVIVFDIIGLKITFVGQRATYLYGMMRPFTLLAVLCLLIGFRHLDIRNNRIINIIASATFGVYLIHDNNFVRSFLWIDLFRNASFQDSPYLIPYSIAVIFIVYISCTIIELMRSKFFKALSCGRLS